MTSYIFIENGTNIQFNLVDADVNPYGTITPAGTYSLAFNYSENFEKQYVLVFGNNQVSFWLSVNGDIIRVAQNNVVNLQIKNSVCKIRFGGTMKYDRLVITPLNNAFARPVPMLSLPVPDYVTRLDFTG